MKYVYQVMFKPAGEDRAYSIGTFSTALKAVKALAVAADLDFTDEPIGEFRNCYGAVWTVKKWSVQ